MTTVRSEDSSTCSDLSLLARELPGLVDQSRTLARCSTVEARALLSAEFAVRYQLLPLGVLAQGSGEGLLLVAASAPLTAEARRELRFITAHTVAEELVRAEVIDQAILFAYSGDERLAVALSERSRREFVSTPERVPTDFSEATIPQLVNSILHRAALLCASDVHLEPRAERLKVRFRIDGRLREDRSFSLPAGVARAVSRRIKVLAALDITEEVLPQDGSFSAHIGAVELRVRVAILPDIFGPRIVLRLLEGRSESSGPSSIPTFSALGMTREQELLFESALGSDHGVVLLCGPTGSGKSTLLASAVERLRSDWRHIVTIEDPVERIIPGVTQIEVKRSRGLDFPQILPAVLRTDPDVILVGEIRDAVTADVSFSAGLSGHIVLSTVHAPNCIELFFRLLQLGVQPGLIAASLRLAVSQRLLAKNCPDCAAPCSLSAELCRLLGLAADTRFVAATGCVKCQQTGVNGRLGVFELLRIDERIQNLIAPRADAGHAVACSRGELREAAAASGYRSFAHGVREALYHGQIAPQTALRALGIAPSLFGL